MYYLFLLDLLIVMIQYVFVDVDGLGMCGDNREVWIYANSSFLIKDSSRVIPVGAVVALELDMNTRVLYFFVGDEQLPWCVTSVPDGVCFAVCQLSFLFSFNFFFFIC
jgi:hypothetical protein